MRTDLDCCAKVRHALLYQACLAGMIGCVASSQVMLKFAGNHISPNVSMGFAFIVNPWLWGSFLASGMGLVFWSIALRGMPLAKAYPWTAMIYVLTSIASILVFNDSVDFRYCTGMVLVVLGVFIAARGVINS
jgi:multidrug transporter EmrE-like cation transporter